jgi:hypothetical protein
VARRLCEVVVALPDGKRYSVMLEAESVFHAAVLFYSHCAAPHPGQTPPRIDMQTMLEVRPVYSVRMEDAMAWANREAQKRHRELGRK